MHHNCLSNSEGTSVIHAYSLIPLCCYCPTLFILYNIYLCNLLLLKQPLKSFSLSNLFLLKFMNHANTRHFKGLLTLTALMSRSETYLRCQTHDLISNPFQTSPVFTQFLALFSKQYWRLKMFLDFYRQFGDYMTLKIYDSSCKGLTH